MGRVRDVERVVIEGRQRPDHAAHHRHGMRVAPKSRVEAAKFLLHFAVALDVADEIVLLVGRGQFAVQQQVAQFQEIRLFGELFDGVSAMQENPLVAVDIGDVGIAGGGGDETGIVGEVSLAGESAHVDHVRADARRVYW